MILEQRWWIGGPADSSTTYTGHGIGGGPGVASKRKDSGLSETEAGASCWQNIDRSNLVTMSTVICVTDTARQFTYTASSFLTAVAAWRCTRL